MKGREEERERKRKREIEEGETKREDNADSNQSCRHIPVKTTLGC